MRVYISKRRILFALVPLITLYCVLQYYIHRHVADSEYSRKHNVNTNEASAGLSSPKERNVDREDGLLAAHFAIQSFMDVCHSQGIPVFIIDQYVLLALSNSVSLSSSCKYLCTGHSSTAFGILSHLWRITEYVEDSFRRRGFTLKTFHQFAEFTSQTLLAHVLVSHANRHTIHVVLFHQRGENAYLWHGRLTSILNNSIGRHEGAYDRFDLVKVKLDGVKVRVPKNQTEFLMEMTSSKFIGCNHSRAALFYDEFGARETSADAQLFYKAARDILVKAKHVLDSMGIRFWLSSGTCLGWLRQCDLIPHSKDVDIGIWIKDYKEGVIEMLQDADLLLIQQFGKIEDSFELSFTSGNVKLDVFFFYEEDSYMWNGGTQARTGKKFKYKFPPFSLCWTEFLELKVRVPCETETYIEANYGINWFRPVKLWDWKKSPSNVEPNGEWRPEEREDVIQQWNQP